MTQRLQNKGKYVTESKQFSFLYLSFFFMDIHNLLITVTILSKEQNSNVCCLSGFYFYNDKITGGFQILNYFVVPKILLYMCSRASAAFTRAITLSSFLSVHTRVTWENFVFILTFHDNADVQANCALQTLPKVSNSHLSEQDSGSLETQGQDFFSRVFLTLSDFPFLIVPGAYIPCVSCTVASTCCTHLFNYSDSYPL